MFEWLEEEIVAIKTRRFHVIAGTVGGKLEMAVFQSEVHLPVSYCEFILKFGNARLYRQSRNGYQIGIFAGPREMVLKDGTKVYHLGFYDGANIYVKADLNFDELSIFEFQDGSEEKVADNFAEWLNKSCARARCRYSKKKWAEILNGPKPFTAEEQEIIQTRQQIQWRVLGTDSTGDHIFEVTNAANRTLPVLTVGVRSKDNRLNGAVLLKIGDLRPGQTILLHADCYKEFVSPNETEIFALPDPQPEDREFYSELRAKL